MGNTNTLLAQQRALKNKMDEVETLKASIKAPLPSPKESVQSDLLEGDVTADMIAELEQLLIAKRRIREDQQEIVRAMEQMLMVKQHGVDTFDPEELTELNRHHEFKHIDAMVNGTLPPDLDPTFNSWTEEEQRRFLQAFPSFGTRGQWDKLARCVGTRSESEVREHAQIFLQKRHEMQFRPQRTRAPEPVPTIAIHEAQAMAFEQTLLNLGIDPATEWSLDEQAVLEEGLRQFPLDDCSTAQRYIKIAALLETKLVRDVALRFKWMMDRFDSRSPGVSRSNSENSLFEGDLNESGDRPSLKRDSLRSTPNIAEREESTSGKRGSLVKKGTKARRRRKSLDMRRDSNPPLPVPEPAPELSPEQTQRILDENDNCNSELKEILMSGELSKTWSPMVRFHANMSTVLKGMGPMTGIAGPLPPLRLNLNTSLLAGHSDSASFVIAPDAHGASGSPGSAPASGAGASVGQGQSPASTDAVKDKDTDELNMSGPIEVRVNPVQ